jgi:hypothetical protein
LQLEILFHRHLPSSWLSVEEQKVTNSWWRLQRWDAPPPVDYFMPLTALVIFKLNPFVLVGPAAEKYSR